MDPQQQEENKKSLLQPYKTIGQICDNNPAIISQTGKKQFLTVSTNHTYKVYKLPNLKIALLSPTFPHRIRCIQHCNEFVFIAVKNIIYQMHYYHIINTFTGHVKKISHLRLIGSDFLISCDIDNVVMTIDLHSLQIVSKLKVGFDIEQIIHPMTYLNKILLIGSCDLELWNISTRQLICGFQDVLDKMLCADNNGKIEINQQNYNNAKKEILCAEQSPILDVIALSLTNGDICMLNLRSGQVLFSLHQPRPAYKISFSKINKPLLASCDENGNLYIFDLNKQSLLARVLNSHGKCAVSTLLFVTIADEFVLVTASGEENTMKMWKYEEAEAEKFQILRERKGIQFPIQKLRFYDDNGYHILCSSSNGTGEMIDFSLLNESNTKHFQPKKSHSQKQLQKQNKHTEHLHKGSQIVDFAFSLNRAHDWANVLTCSKNNSRPSLWNAEDHSLDKHQVQLYDSDVQKQTGFDFENHFITSVSVTNCGNFGMLGYSDGYICKINMQSGKFQKAFLAPLPLEQQQQSLQHQNKNINNRITGLLVDKYNSLLVSSDFEGNLSFWEFYSAQLLNQVPAQSNVQNNTQNHVINNDQNCSNFDRQKIALIRDSNFSQLFLVARCGTATDAHRIEVWDMTRQIKARCFPPFESQITDATFTPDNKFIIASSNDMNLRIFDVVSGIPIQVLKCKETVLSLSISNDGEILATANANSKEVHLWHNLIYMKPWGNQIQPINVMFSSEIQTLHKNDRTSKSGSKLITKVKEETGEKCQNKMFMEIQQLLMRQQIENHKEKDTAAKNTELIQFTQVPAGRWQPLVHLDQIKARSRPDAGKDVEMPAMPFFLDFENKDSVRQQMVKEHKQALHERSRVLKEGKDQLMRANQLGSQLDKYLLSKNINEHNNKHNANNNENQTEMKEIELFDELKTMLPSQVDFEFRKNLFGNSQNVYKMAAFFRVIFSSKTDYDLKIVYFNKFLHISYDQLFISQSQEQEQIIKDLQSLLAAHSSSLDEKVMANLQILESFAKIRN